MINKQNLQLLMAVAVSLSCFSGTDYSYARDLPEVRYGTTRALSYSRANKYEYAPDATFLSPSLWWVYFCTLDNDPDGGDAIYRIVSANGGKDWIQETRVLSSGGEHGGVHVCDPSVVQYQNSWHMFYTSNERIPNHSGNRNRIYHAVSSNGLNNWIKKGLAVDMINPKTKSYGAGQSSVLWDPKRKIWTMYYTDTSLGRNQIYRIDSPDLSQWDVTSRVKVTMPNPSVSWDVSYDAHEKGFFAVSTSVGDAITPGLIQVLYSNDGLRFFKISEIPSSKQVNHNPGILRNPIGHINAPTAVFWGGGLGGPKNRGASTWDLIQNSWIYWDK